MPVQKSLDTDWIPHVYTYNVSQKSTVISFYNLIIYFQEISSVHLYQVSFYKEVALYFAPKCIWTYLLIVF